MVKYSSYFMQASRLSRYVRTLSNYIFMGTEFGKGGPILAAKIGPGGPFLAVDRFFRYRTISMTLYFQLLYSLGLEGYTLFCHR